MLYGAGWLLVRLAGRLRGAVGVAWRYGVANLARRGRESVVQIVAFGLGLMVLLLLAVVRDDLLETWRASLPTDTPNYFMINIPDAETRDFARFIEERGLPAPRLFPMIRARMSAINGKPIEEIKPATDRGEGFAEREQNLSWAETPQLDNKIVVGTLVDGSRPRQALRVGRVGVPGGARPQARRPRSPSTSPARRSRPRC